MRNFIKFQWFYFNISIFFFFILLYIYFYFFFSSRRRHTRCGRDWSSDVCSSDLKLNSDGYIDRSWADMSSYFLQGTFLEKNTLIKALLFGGKQKTYQAWNGLEQDRKSVV